MADFVKNRDGEKEKGKGLSCSDGRLKDENSRKTDDNVKRKFENEDIDGVALDDTEPKKQKVSVGFNKTFGSLKTIRFSEKKNPTPITIKLGAQKTKDGKPSLLKTSASVASAFNQESDSEEEMPPEAKMRMRNIGRDTPTSAGPNSFGKTRHGFCDSKKVFERQLKEKMEQLADE
ncbi:PEST proteolytic signal-containing nuclear protein [Caerostris darwini]|uniref:PEST proteolytic signal-containing nuclear protein n=1 Tax=Caerostris darwini TaxID=1538125 RepID=A0AAV4T2W5_9ARAC|nr:PEST proteolytic signal-containing nuclear protein [Caerostris darwini]